MRDLFKRWHECLENWPKTPARDGGGLVSVLDLICKLQRADFLQDTTTTSKAIPNLLLMSFKMVSNPHSGDFGHK